MDAAAILQSLHGRLLRAACAHSKQHFEGLGAAGRALFRAGRISSKTKTKFAKMDIVCGFLRHASEPLADKMWDEFIFELASPTKVAGRAEACNPVDLDGHVKSSAPPPPPFAELPPDMPGKLDGMTEDEPAKSSAPPPPPSAELPPDLPGQLDEVADVEPVRSSAALPSPPAELPLDLL